MVKGNKGIIEMYTRMSERQVSAPLRSFLTEKRVAGFPKVS